MSHSNRVLRFNLVGLPHATAAIVFAAVAVGPNASAQEPKPAERPVSTESPPPKEPAAGSTPSKEAEPRKAGEDSAGEPTSPSAEEDKPVEAAQTETSAVDQTEEASEEGAASDKGEAGDEPSFVKRVAPPPKSKASQPASPAAPEAGAASSAEAQAVLEGADVGDIDLMNLLEIDVSTATKTSESLDEAPAIITAITAAEINRWGYQSVGEVLQHVTGFYLVDDHITPNAAVRGMTGGLGAESSVIKVMIDGRSVAFRSTSGNWLGVELIPLSAIKQIEVIRGPASALYGADAFLGVVNIITLAPVDLPRLDARATGIATGQNAGGKFDVTAGSWGETYDVMLTAAGEMTNRSGLQMPAESPAPRVPSYNDPYGRAQGLERRSLVFGGRVGMTDKDQGHHLILSAYASGVRRGGDFAHWSQLTTGRDSLGHESGSVVSLGQMRVNADALYQATESFAIAAQTTYFQGGLLPQDRIEVGSDLFFVERKMAYRGVDLNVEGRWLPSKRFNVIVGSEIVYDNETLPSATRISKEDGSVLQGSVSDESADLINLGAYLSSNVQVIEEWLKLTAGGRYDYHNRYQGQASGRFGATSQLFDGFIVKALFGRAFKAPSPYLLFAEPLAPGDVIGNEELKPQFIHTWEGQISYRPNHYFRASSAVSYNLLLDKAEFVPQGINQAAQNAARQTAVSWESSIALSNGDIVGGDVSFDLVRSYRESDLEGYQAEVVGNDMVAYPAWTGRVGAYVGLPSPPQLPLELSSRAIIVGPRQIADTSILESGGSFELPPYVLLNASLHTGPLAIIPFHETICALRAKNILGGGGPDPGFSGFEYPLTAREILIELRHRY